jgi:arginyl-tRNA synthetase
MDFKHEIIALLKSATKLSEEELSPLVSSPPDPKMGDYAFPCFKLGKNAKEEADKLKVKLKLPQFVEKVEVSGPYLNFYVSKTFLTEQTLSIIRKEKKKYGAGTEKKNIVVEFCSPNTNKPLHLGHVRNMALGDAMGRILAFRGNKVHPVEIINDRGVHICKSMLAYERWGNSQKPNKKTDHFVGDYYVLFAAKAKEDEHLEQEAQEILVKWEHEDKKVRALWKKMNKWVVDGFRQTYTLFGVKFEKEYFESDFYTKGKDIAYDGLDKGFFIKDETGAIVAPLDDFELGKKVIVRGDGTAVYITQDLYLAELRYQEFKCDQQIYVVASEQNLHFKQLFKIMELFKRPYAKNLYHLSYGLVNLPTGRMKSREGTVVDADDIMEEMFGLAEKEIRARYTELSEAEIKKRAHDIGISALRFYMLRVDAIKEMIFNPQESISFEGETGPYVQYTHARACSIIRKAAEKSSVKISLKVDFSKLKEKEELAVIKLLYDFPEAVSKAAELYKPHIVTSHLLLLAQKFNEFYHAQQVISDDKELMKARLLLVDSVRQVLANGLGLLGIVALEEM